MPRLIQDREFACVVREARAHPAPLPADVIRHVERASRATEFHRVGRHAAAERLLRDVAGSLTRRTAFAPAAATLITLGCLLLERGRAAAAEKVFEEAHRCADSAGEELPALDARLWQAAARTDAARLTDAESVCRTVLLASALTPGRQAWAHATLARILLWQGRMEEAAACFPSLQHDGLDIDPVVVAAIEATAVRVLLATGEAFRAGQRARTLLSMTDKTPDTLARVVALTAHLRVLAAAGDLSLAQDILRDVIARARRLRVPLRTVRARLIWHDALRRAGRAREAQRELQSVARVGRVGPALLRRAGCALMFRAPYRSRSARP